MEVNPARANMFGKRFKDYLRRKTCLINIVKQMISKGADVNYQDKDLNTPLHIVLQDAEEKLSLVRELIAADANVNACNLQGRSALHYAVLYADDVEILRELVDKGANVDLRDSDNNSPLHLAVQNNKKPFVQALIGYGADVDMKNSRQDTALVSAVRNDNLDIVKVLLRSSASVSLLDRVEYGPLHVAVDRPVPNPSILIELIDKGAAMWRWDPSMQLSIEWAIKRSFENPSHGLSSAQLLMKCSALHSFPGLERILLSNLRRYNDGRDLCSFMAKCTMELLDMRKELIHKNFSLLDFVRNGFKDDPMCQTETAYREMVFNHILYISPNYPAYTDVIAYRLGKLPLCKKSMSLCISASKEYPAGKREIFLTPDVVFLISKLLSEAEVLNLITAFSDSQNYVPGELVFEDIRLGISTKRKRGLNY